MKRLGPAGLLDLGLRTGPYKKQKEGRPALSLRALKKAPHGIDLGPLRPCLDTRLCTKDKKIRLAPECLVAELSAVRTQIATFAAEGSLVPQESTPEAARDGVPFLLIGRRHLRSNNSWMHNSERLMRGKDRCTMLLHPEDGEAHGFADGGQVTIVSRVGELTCAVEWSDEIMPGVVSVPHGWGHQRKGVKLQVAVNQPGVSVNDLTDELAVDAVCGTSVLNGVPVWLKAVDDA
jgi:anaerobic selenocysteine-containing dehydrogenase